MSGRQQKEVKARQDQENSELTMIPREGQQSMGSLKKKRGGTTSPRCTAGKRGTAIHRNKGALARRFTEAGVAGQKKKEEKKLWRKQKPGRDDLPKRQSHKRGGSSR